MKKGVLFFLFACAFQANATVHTVSNRADGGAQFNNLQNAINAAQSGDTLYIHGSQDTYGNVTIADKALTLIGPGFLPAKENPVTAVIGTITFTNDPQVPGDSNGSEVQGVEASVIYFSSAMEHNNVRILRNYLVYVYINATTYGGKYSNFTFEGNYFTGGISGYGFNQGYSNIVIQNNVFAQSAAIQTITNASNVIVNHNIFYSSSKSAAFSGGCRNLLVTNNIFSKKGFGANDIIFSTFSNNLTFDSGNTNEPWTISNNVNGGGNIANENPQTVSQADLNTGKNNVNLDFAVTGGPAKNGGSDGKDIGLLYETTGSLNWNNGRSARLPMVVSMTIANPTVGPGVNLNVQVSAKKNN